MNKHQNWPKQSFTSISVLSSIHELRQSLCSLPPHPARGTVLGSHHLPRTRQAACSATPVPSPQDLGSGGRGLGLSFCDPDPKCTPNQQVPSENHSSEEISISTGSQELPCRAEQPTLCEVRSTAPEMCFVLTGARKRLAEGGWTYTCSISRWAHPQWGVDMWQALTEQLCSAVYMHPLICSSHQPMSGLVTPALQMRRQSLK